MLLGEKKITFEEYMAMPIGAPYQLISGCLVDWPSRTPLHQVVLGGIIEAVAKFEGRSEVKGMFLMGPIETIFDNENSFQPDFIYIAEDRLDIVKDYVYGAPDIVIEILWKKNAYYDLRPKKDIYEKYGVKEYIILDYSGGNADLYILKNGSFHLHQKAMKSESLLSLVLPGLIFDLNKIFDFSRMPEAALGG